MDTRIQNIQSALSALRTANDAAARLTKPIQAAEAEGHGFGVALESALRSVSDRLGNNPTRYLLGKDAPKEFDPHTRGKSQTP